MHKNQTRMIGCVFITAVPLTKLFAWGGRTREEPSTATQGAPVFPGSSYSEYLGASLGMRVLGTAAQHSTVKSSKNSVALVAIKKPFLCSCSAYVVKRTLPLTSPVTSLSERQREREGWGGGGKRERASARSRKPLHFSRWAPLWKSFLFNTLTFARVPIQLSLSRAGARARCLLASGRRCADGSQVAHCSRGIVLAAIC
jgi:hypothetical protein